MKQACLILILIFALWVANEDSSSSEVLVSPEALKGSEKNSPVTSPKFNDNADVSQLENIISANKYSMILFDVIKSRKQKHRKILLRLSKHFSKMPVTFTRILVRNPKDFKNDKYKIDVIPSFYMFISGNKKHYTGLLKLKNLKTWIKEIIAAKPLHRKKVSDIENIDKHYFVYTTLQNLKRSKGRFETLSKLISPLSVYTGFTKEELNKLTKGRQLKGNVGIFREYQNQIIDLDSSMSLEDQASFITKHEFPDYMVCNASALRFIQEFKIPVLVYFSSGDADTTWDVVKEVGYEFKEYALTVLVKPQAKDRCSDFLRKFLNVKSVPALRIISLVGKVKRHTFLGNFDRQHIKFFMTHYISGNLKSYTISQNVKPSDNIQGIKVANFDAFRKAMNDSNRTSLFYIYDSGVKTLKKDLRALHRLKDNLKDNLAFDIYAIDHDQNDLDGYYNNSLPLIFLIAKKSRFVHYDEKKITTKNLLEFVKAQAPYLKTVLEPLETDL